RSQIIRLGARRRAAEHDEWLAQVLTGVDAVDEVSELHRLRWHGTARDTPLVAVVLRGVVAHDAELGVAPRPAMRRQGSVAYVAVLRLHDLASWNGDRVGHAKVEDRIVANVTDGLPTRLLRRELQVPFGRH